MIDLFEHVKLIPSSPGRLQCVSLKSYSWSHDPTLTGGDMFADEPKLLFIYENAHFHLYYTLGQDTYENCIDYERSGITFKRRRVTDVIPNESGIHFECDYVIETMEECIREFIFLKYGELLREDELVAIIASDIHGDPTMLRLALALSGNMRLVMADIDGFHVEVAPRCICILNGDFYSQSPDYFKSQVKRSHYKKDAEDRYRCVTKCLAGRIAPFENVMSSVVRYISSSDLCPRSCCYSVIGNHDAPIKDYDKLFALLVLHVGKRLYLIQHGLFNMRLFYDTRLSCAVDMEIMDCVYNPANVKPIARFTRSLYLNGILYSDIVDQLEGFDTTYVSNKYKALITSTAHPNAISLLNKLTAVNISYPLSLFHGRSDFELKKASDRIERFITLIAGEDVEEHYIILGHSGEYLKLPFVRSNDFPSTDLVPIDFSNPLSNPDPGNETLFKNTISTDSNRNSLTNGFIRRHVISSLTGGYLVSQKWKYVILILLILVIIIYAIHVLRKRIYTYINMKEHSKK